MKSRIVIVGVIFVIVIGVFLSWYQVQQRRSEERLHERANEYWEARRLNDWHTVYAMEAETANGSLSPDEVDTRPEWGKRIYSYELGKMERFDDSAEIEIKKSIILREFTQPIESGKASKDVWTFVDRDWYHGLPVEGSSEIRKSERAKVDIQTEQATENKSPGGPPTIKPDTFGL